MNGAISRPEDEDMAEKIDIQGADRARRKRVLVVDDDEDTRYVLSRYLDEDLYEIVGEAGTGSDAVFLATSLQPDVVILDEGMPVMNGSHAAELIRWLVPGIRIVACSGMLKERPPWADAHVPKARMKDIAHAVSDACSVGPALVSTRPRPR